MQSKTWRIAIQTAAFGLLMLLTLAQSAAAQNCRQVYGQGEPRLTLATGSPGELGLVAALAEAFLHGGPGSVCWIKAGSGASLKLLKARKVDLVMVHAPAAEKAAVAQGWARDRTLIGGNEFFLVGPADDPAGVAEAQNATQAYARVASAKARFISRGDNSGTHKREMAIWRAAGITPGGGWYLTSKDFMLASLRLAAREKAYFMTDSSTWYLGRKKHGLEGLAVLFKGDPVLINEYHALTQPKGATPGADLAGRFIRFLASKKGQCIIGAFGKAAYGQPLYTPAAEVGGKSR